MRVVHITPRNEWALQIEALARGYLQTACVECGNYTLYGDDHALRCDTCGNQQTEALSGDPNAHVVIPLDMRPDEPYADGALDEREIAHRVRAGLRFEASITAHAALWGLVAIAALVGFSIIAKALGFAPMQTSFRASYLSWVIAGSVVACVLMLVHVVAVDFKWRLEQES